MRMRLKYYHKLLIVVRIVIWIKYEIFNVYVILI